MVKFIFAGGPEYEAEDTPLMLAMAFDARAISSTISHHLGVVSAPLLNPAADLLVTKAASRFRAAGAESMALKALQWLIK